MAEINIIIPKITNAYNEGLNARQLAIKTRYEGRGIGYVICNLIVKAVNQYIRAENNILLKP